MGVIARIIAAMRSVARHTIRSVGTDCGSYVRRAYVDTSADVTTYTGPVGADDMGVGDECD